MYSVQIQNEKANAPVYNRNDRLIRHVYTGHATTALDRDQFRSRHIFKLERYL